MDGINFIILLATCLLALPVLTFCSQVLSALFLKSPPESDKEIPRPSVAILIPAHNEEAVIKESLDSIVPQLKQSDILLVVADNCQDNTADIARNCGAMVIERQHQTKRGKGYALDFGIQYLRKHNSPEVVIIIDADCKISKDGIEILAKKSWQNKKPVQGFSLMEATYEQSIKQKISEFAWRVKNLVRPKGMLNVSFPCQLMGTGMAFPWELINTARLAHGNMVEDMKLGIDLAIEGFAPMFCPEVQVYSQFPQEESIIQTQRTRWEHGHLATILSEAPRLLKAALLKADKSLLAMALDLAVPPLSVLALLITGLCFISLVVAASTEQWDIFLGPALLLMVFAVAVLAAWYGFARQIVSFKTLGSIPYYMIQKIPLYLGFLFNRQQGWVKTKRK